MEGSKICAGNTCVDGLTFMKFISRLSKNDYMYSPNKDDYFIYEDIGSYPSIFSGMTVNNNGWHCEKLYIILSGASYPTGLKINVDLKYGTIWVRILNERFTTFALYDSKGTICKTYKDGGENNYSTSISPDGGLLLLIMSCSNGCQLHCHH